MNIIEKLGITPGPWKYVPEKTTVSRSTIGPYELFFDTVEYGTGERAARLHNSADARLIAAAPEMLEALISVCLLFETLNHMKDMESLVPVIESATGKTWEEIKGLL